MWCETQNPATARSWGFAPPFGTNKINDLQRPNFLHTPQKGMTLPVTLPIALQTTLDVQPF